MVTDQTPESRLASTLHAAVRRRRIQLIIQYTSSALILTAVAALLMLIADRIFAVHFSDAVIIAAALLGLPVGILLGWRSNPSPHDTAVILDNAYHLKNRLSSALDLVVSSTISVSPCHADPVTRAFTELTCLDAGQSCDHINIKNTFPLKWSRSSYYAVGLTIALIAAAVWCPDWSGWLTNPRQNEQLIARRDKELAAARAIRQAELNMQNLQDALASKDNNIGDESTATNDETDQVIQTLHNLSSQLTTDSATDNTTDTPDSTNDQAPPPRKTVAQAAETLNELAQKLNDSATEDQHIADTLRKRLNQISTPGSDNNSIPDSQSSSEALHQLTQALKQNNTQKTIDEINRLQREIEHQSPREKQQLAKDLRNLAQQLSPQPTENSKQNNSKQNNAKPDNKNQNSANSDNENNQSSPPAPSQEHSQTEKQPEENGNPEQQINNTEKQLQQNGVDPESADEFANKQHQRDLTKQAEHKADQEMRKTSEELRRWADELDKSKNKNNTTQNKKNTNTKTSQQPQQSPPAKPRSEDTQQTPQQPSPKTENPAPQSNQQPQPNPKQQPPANTNTNTEQPAENNSQSQKVKDNQQPGDKDKQNGAQKTNNPNQNTDKNDLATQKQNNSPEPQTPEQSLDNQQSPESPQSENQQQKQQQQSQNSKQQQSQQSEQQQQQQQKQSNDNQQSTEPGEAVRRLQEAVRRMGSYEKQARQRQTVSEEAKKQAQQLIEQMTPDQRDQLKRWTAQQTNPDNPNADSTPGKAPPPPSQPPSQPNDNNRNGRSQSQTSTPQVNPTSSEQTPYQYTIRDIDARNTNASPNQQSPDSANDRVLSEWLHPSPGDRTTPLRTTGQNTRQLQPAEIKQATRAAERALDEEAVAPRYRNLLKKWTDQLSKQLNKIKIKNETAKSDKSSTNTSK